MSEKINDFSGTYYLILIFSMSLLKYPRQIGVGDTKITPYAKALVKKVLDSNRLSYGPFCREFEDQFAKIHGRRFAILANSGTSALQVALHALKIKYCWPDQAEVLVPALTFVATVNIITANNLKPVFVDVDPKTYNLDPKKIEAKITKKTKAIIPVSLCGLPCEIDKILKIAKKYRLKVLEDSCETMFVKYRGKPAGSLADVACYSTYVAHLITTGVGGFIATNDRELAILSRSLVNHGRDSIYIAIDDDAGKKGRQLKEVMGRRFSFIHQGYSYRITEMEAALGLGELKNWRANIKKRQNHARFLIKSLKPFQQYLQLPSWPAAAEHGFMMFPLTVVSQKIKRDDLTLFLEEHNVETRPLLPLINQPIYRRLFGNLEPQLPVAAYLTHHAFYIGCHPFLGQKELNYIVKVFQAYFKERGLF